MKHQALVKGPLPTHTCFPGEADDFPGNHRTKTLLSPGWKCLLRAFTAADPQSLKDMVIYYIFNVLKKCVI